MSEPAPDRTIAGLTPRPRASASILMRENRPQQPARNETSPTLAPESQKPAKTTRATSRTTPKRRTVKNHRDGRKEQVAALIDATVRQQARGAFRVAAFYEGVPSFAQLVENALVREIERLQREYNDGQPFEPVTVNLTPGRPVGN